MAISLPVQLQISLNARLFKIFNIRDNRTFTIAHLRKTLGASFHISHEKIRFNLVSGRYTRDSDALFDLRASDGNSASLDVELPPAYIHSSLSNGVISLRFLSNACPVALQDVFCDGIVEVQDPSSSPRIRHPLPSGRLIQTNLMQDTCLSIATPRDSRREVILRVTLLRYSFQQTILQRLQDGPALIPSRSLENLKLTPAPPTAPVLTPSTTLPTKTASRDNSSR
ncbi:hypothetical protein PSHT_09833 [Puccinia striiformis]|uniref:Ubiquitin-like domain-containing protein n=1 Tax=Puccinia striiformis TaxID=27350 RepID=A0A2S4VDW6_9BASI|nr:hypothetical protein PSHT_09833 [Puccinia striiformis]